jgi:hypothetical protein
MCIAAAVAGAGVVGSVAGGALSASGAKSAANTQAEAANNATQMQWQQFQQMQQNLQPYMDLGQYGISNQKGLLQSGLLNPTFSFNPTQAQLEQTPGYQFTLQQGLKNTNNALAAKGLNLSGAQAKGLSQFTTGLASNTYQQQYQNALQNFMTNYNVQSDLYNRYGGLTQLGQNSAAGVGTAGLQTANNAGNYLTQGANAQAAGQIGAANAINQGLGGVSSNGLLYSLLRNNNAGANSGAGTFSSGIYGSSNYDTSFDTPDNYG